MPGTYAHLTLVNLAKESDRLEALGVPDDAIAAVQQHFRFCELGAVSPDYPYLSVGDSAAKQWADLMHYERTGDLLLAGVARVRGMQGGARDKLLAWLLGYVAHVGADVTIHPVVELKVGPYKGNEDAHRLCEMHQDTYIFQRLGVGEVGLSEHLDSGVALCSAPEDTDRLDPQVKELWTAMLRDVHPASSAANPPNMDRWHCRFRQLVGGIAEEGYRLTPLARHVAAGLGLTYPRPSEVRREFLEALKTPRGPQHYDAVFDRALRNVGRLWLTVARGALGLDDAYRGTLGNWNLDTGRDSQGRLVMWEDA
jgi:hypothetical protein